MRSQRIEDDLPIPKLRVSRACSRNPERSSSIEPTKQIGRSLRQQLILNHFRVQELISESSQSQR